VLDRLRREEGTVRGDIDELTVGWVIDPP
jgi:hypothetical protein